MAKGKTHRVNTQSKRPGQTRQAIKRLQMTLQANEALTLRNHGFTYQDIAGRLNMASPGAAHFAVQEAMAAELANPADRAHQRLESDAFYRQLIKLLMPMVLKPKPNLGAIPHLIKLRQRLDEIWGLDLGKQLERDGISDALLAVLHEMQARPLGSGTPEPVQPALPDPSTLDAIWHDMSHAGEVDEPESPEPEEGSDAGEPGV